jgi:hypothetical protein
MTAPPNHNGGPPRIPFTPATKLECIKAIVERTDLTSAQKCVGVGLIVTADREWTSFAKTEDLRRMASVKDRETVFAATRTLDQKGIVSKEAKRGQAGKYTVLPPSVVDAIVDAYEQKKTGRVESDQSEPKGSGETGRVNQSDPTTFPVGLNRTGRVEPVGSIPTTNAHDAHAVVSNNININNNLTTTHTPLTPQNQPRESVCVPGDGPRSGEEHRGHGVYLNCNTVRHKAFSISIEAIAMQLATASGLGLTFDEAREYAKNGALSHALDWAVQIENGKLSGDVVPKHIANFIRGSVASQLTRTANSNRRTASTANTGETPDQRKKRLFAQAQSEMRDRK